LTAHEAPAGRLVPHVFVCEKSPLLVPVTLMDSGVSIAFPVLVRVRAWALEVSPAMWLPNARVVGEMTIDGWPGFEEYAEVKFAVVLAVSTIVWLAGANRMPGSAGVTVYEPLTRAENE
jgi:hypothetical protein